jgi:Protein of unknown function with HXXEE motif
MQLHHHKPHHRIRLVLQSVSRLTPPWYLRFVYHGFVQTNSTQSNKIMTLQDSAFWLVAIALILHTIAEGWLPEYEKHKPDWQAVAFNRALWLDNFPIFVFAIVLAAIGWRLPIVSGILPAVGVTHPLLDHVGLSWKMRQVRPGSWTGLFLMLPLSVWVYTIAYGQNLFKPIDLAISFTIGLAISIWLYWSVIQAAQQPH